jgi:DNA-binding transcriptional LysR family regulator
VSLTRIDLNLLVTLEAVLSEQSVARAAERLHVTPSAVSNALARLRALLNDPLVIRSGRGIVPTPRGLELAPALKSALGDLDRAMRKQVFDPATTTRSFTLAVSDAGQISWLPAFARLLSDEMPNAGLRAIGIDSYLSWGGPPSTEVDVAIAAIDEVVPGVHIVPLYEERSVLVARAGRFSTKSRLSKAQLSRLRHVEVQVVAGRGNRALAPLYAEMGIERRVVMTVPTFVAAAAVVAETDLVATLPASLVDRFGDEIELVRLRTPAPVLTTAVNLVWHERTNDDPASRAFRTLLARSFADQ